MYFALSSQSEAPKHLRRLSGALIGCFPVASFYPTNQKPVWAYAFTVDPFMLLLWPDLTGEEHGKCRLHSPNGARPSTSL